MAEPTTKPHPLAFPALLLGNAALACGPWLVRLSDVGAVASGFWRLALALPFLWLLSHIAGQPLGRPKRAVIAVTAFAALFFAADLAAWHAGIRLTKLANAALFGNVSSIVFAAWGLWLARSLPSRLQGIALSLAMAGAALLMMGSAELSPRYLKGDLLALLAGLFYAGYLVAIERARVTMGSLPLLLLATLFGAAMLLPLSLLLGEQVMPTNWTPLILLAIGSQVIGQGLLVYAIGALSPLIVGLTLLTQPAIAAAIGYIFYDEKLSLLDWAGAAAIAVALILVQWREADLRRRAESPS